MAVKCTYFIQTITTPGTANPARAGGFSETFYRDGSSIDTSTISQLATLAALRAGFLAGGDKVVGSRLSLVEDRKSVV